MCELIRINYDKHGSTPEKDLQVYKRGMYVLAQDDGWEWNEKERTSPAYTIVKLPGVPKDHPDVQRLLEADEEELEWTPEQLLLPIDARGPKQTRMKRRRKLKAKVEEFTKTDEDFLKDEKNTVSERLVRIHTRCEDLTVTAKG